jgi:hypothetical protein
MRTSEVFQLLRVDCDDKRDFCEEALVVVIVSKKYDCSQGRIRCQGYCDTLPK